MFIVKIADYSECYLCRVQDHWQLKMNIKLAEPFKTEKSASRAVKEWHKEKTGRSLHTPVKQLSYVEIIKKETA